MVDRYLICTSIFVLLTVKNKYDKCCNGNDEIISLMYDLKHNPNYKGLNITL